MSSSGKIALTVPSALLWLFAYTQHAWNRHHFQAFPPISPVSGAVPLTLTRRFQPDKLRTNVNIGEGQHQEWSAVKAIKEA